MMDLSRDLETVREMGRSLGFMEASIEVLRLAEKFQSAGKYDAYAAARDCSDALKNRSNDIAAIVKSQQEIK